MTRRDKRRRFSEWMRSVFVQQAVGLQPRRIVVEPLERREVFAGDILADFLGSNNPATNATGLGSTELVGASQTGIAAEGELQAEGEAAPDLVAFAKALSAAGVQFFGAAWCPFCNEQKALFQDGAKYLPYIEVTNPDRTPNQIAIDEGITQYPTWKFNNPDPNLRTAVGVQTLATISERSGVAIPLASTPYLSVIPDATVAIGSPLMVPVDAYDPNGNPLTITVESSNPNVVSATVLSGNSNLRLSTNFGDMVFQLFEDKVPNATARIKALAQSGYYDGLLFHRVQATTLIQGGSPNGDGIGGSSLGNLDDEFHLDLQHNRSGVLSLAKTALDDTNNAQFFITEVPLRSLDFNHSVIGQLIEGEATREAISSTATVQISNGNNRPVNNVVINSATIFNDTEDGIVQLKALAIGSSTITVTISDTEGNSTARTFSVTTTQDTANGAPFLNPIPAVNTSVNTPVSITLTSQDKENDTRVYAAQPVGNVTFGLDVNSSTGLVTVTPPTGFTGPLQFRAIVSQSAASTTDSTTDEQVVTVNVGPSAPTSIDLNPASDSGVSSTDNITNAVTLSFTVGGTTAGATVTLRAGGNVVGQATATGTTTTVNVTNPASLGQGAILFTASQTVSGQESGNSPSLEVTYDTTAPVTLASSVFPATVQLGTPLNLNLAHPEEGLGLTYELTNAPTGMTIAAATGILNWAPTLSQIGPHSFSVRYTDTAGNIQTQNVSLNVVSAALAGFTLQTVDMSGNPITTIAAGQNFKVQVFVQDLRSDGAADGLFSAFVDLLYNPSVIEPIANDPITFGANYTTAPIADLGTPGIIDELGALATNAFGGLDTNPQLLAEVTFLAKTSGNAGLQLDPADSSLNDILFFNDPNTILAPEQLSFGSSSFAVGVNFTVANDTFNFDEDSSTQTLNVLSNDIASGGAVLTISAVGQPSAGGTVVIGGNGQTILYTSASNFNGAETFTYTVRNQDNVTLTATVTVQVTDVNDPPLAVNDTFNVFTNSTQNVLDVLANDTRGADAGSSETLTVTSVGTGSQGGTITVGPSGLTLRYTPLTGFAGTESFTYNLSDGRGGTSTATVSVSVAQENPPPTAVSDAFTVVEDAPIANFNVLQNDSTSDAGETLSIASVGTSSAGSQVSVASDGQSIRYQPRADFAGTDIVTYVLRDSRGGTATGTVTFTVTPVNDPPNAVDDSLTVQTSAPTTTLNVLANDVNVDSGETLTITAVTQPPTGQGTIAISSDGRSLIYTSPSTSFEGSFSFTYTISDGSLTDTATVNITAQAFVPRSIGGSLVSGNGQSSGTLSIGGFELAFSGTDYAGQPVSSTATVLPDGTFAINNLAPGNYTIARSALPFLRDSSQQLQIDSAASSGDQLNNQLQVGGLLPQFYDIRDFLGSTPRNSVTVALNADGTQSWFATRGDWSSLRSLNVQMNASGNSLALTATNSSSQNLTGTVAMSNNARVVQVGEQSGMKLLRIVGTPTEAGLVAAPTSTLPTIPPNANATDRAVGANGPNPPTSLTTTASGLQYAILRNGTGTRANANNSSVTVDYKGWLDNGTIFDSSYARTSQSTFALNQVIAGWTEGLQLVGQGGKIQLRIPPNLGYGSNAQGSIPPNSTLNFVVEVTSVTNPAAGEGELVAEGEYSGLAAPAVSTSQVANSQATSSNSSVSSPELLPSSLVSQLVGSELNDTGLSSEAVDSLMSQGMGVSDVETSSLISGGTGDSDRENAGLVDALFAQL